MKHTEGKWEMTGQSENSRYITVKSDNGRTVARVPWNSEKEVEQDICTDYNDALLIASAPEMLKTLKHNMAVAENIQNIIEGRYKDPYELTEYSEANEIVNRSQRIIRKAEKGTE